MHAREAEVFRTERHEVRGRELAHRLRVVDAGWPVAVQGGRETTDVGQLGRALDLRMTRQDLLEQRRAGARQAEDEDWRGIGVARAGYRGQEFRRVRRDQAVVHDLGLHRVVGDLRALHRVAGTVVFPGALVVAAVLPGLAEREQEIDVRLPAVSRRGRAFFHLGDGRIVEPVGLQVREAPVSLSRARGRLDAGVVGGDRTRVVAEGVEGVPEPEQGAGMPGAQLEAVPVRGNGLARERGARERRGSQEMRLHLHGLERDRAREALERLGEAVLLLEEPAEVEDREHEVRRDPDRPLQQLFCVVGPLGLDGDQREQAQRVDVLRVLAQHVPIEALGVLQAAFLLVLGGERHVAPLGREREALLEGGVGLRAAAELRERLAEAEPGALERGIEARGALEEGQGVRSAARVHEQVPEVLRAALRTTARRR